MRAPGRGFVRVAVAEVRSEGTERRDDDVAAEEPLEIRVGTAGGGGELPVGVTMRTPGHDFELAAGYLLSEGVVRARQDVSHIRYCMEGPAEQRYNVVRVALRPGVAFDPGRLSRHVYTSSSCGVCGKASLEAVRRQGLPPPAAGFRLPGRLALALPGALRAAQPLFARTGGLHAAALFDERGVLQVLREDVGRHNAVDKVVGERLLAGAVPLSRAILLVSGRAGFEIVQKALAAGIPAVCAVSAPSSLAVDLARAFDMILVGFLRDGRFNVYAGADRVDAASS